ncbi:MAG: hypothetical protein AAFQ82_28470, partial [Myxococcota bacterium]
SVIEVRYDTDSERVNWTAIEDLEWVHTHLPTCQDNTRQRCGSASVRVAERPRNITMRMRYRPETPLGVEVILNTNIVSSSLPWNDRSLLVYGVFDESNQAIQWRSRHTFPTLRNETVERFGLRREFSIVEQTFADPEDELFVANPYGYAFASNCFGQSLDSGAELQTEDRAVFGAALGPETSDAAAVCAMATVRDALGTFDAPALARKNPEVAPAFPILRSPIRTASQIGTLLTFCDRTISARHESMQVQRLRLEDAPRFCLDDWRNPSFVTELTDFWSERIEQVRANGDDIVVTVALHHDDESGELVARIQDALENVLTPETLEGTPRAVGAFVL